MISKEKTHEWLKDLMDDTDSEIPEYAKNEVNGYIKELPNGLYKGYWYDFIFELEDGKRYYSPLGVKRPKEWSPLEEYEVKDGRLTPIK